MPHILHEGLLIALGRYVEEIRERVYIRNRSSVGLPRDGYECNKTASSLALCTVEVTYFV
jgi:hypothetical protein